VGKVLGRERATPGGVGYAAARLADQTTMAVLAVANAVGDVIDARGEVIGGPRGEDGTLMRTSALVPEMPGFPDPSGRLEQSTTLACVMTDASIDKRGCAIVARMASAGVARAVDPVFSPLDGDVVFCVASGRDPAPTPSLEATWQLAVIGTVAGTLVAEAIRDAVRQASSR
jgi:L-aminopeptidase/D-esterase-like protein